MEGISYSIENRGPRVESGMMSPLRTPKNRRVMVVRNQGATKLQAGDCVKWSAGYVGKRVAKNDVDGGPCAGVVIDILWPAGCVQYDLCFIVIEGPNLCAKNNAGGTDWAALTILASYSDAKVRDAAIGSVATDPAAVTAITQCIGYVITPPLTTDLTVLVDVKVWFV
jgi:hypothetical protein